MKLRNTVISGLAALALATVSAHAQQILTYSGGFSGDNYNDNDLVLSFFSASDTSGSSGINTQGDVLFTLGNVSSFTGLAAGTYSVAGFNGSATSGQPTLGYGSTEINANLAVPNANTFWTVMGSNQTSNEVWITGSTAQTRQSASTQGQLAGNINAIGSAAANNANADGSGYDSAQTTFNDISSAQKWPNFAAVAAVQVPSSSDQLGLYQLLPGTGSGGSSTELGYFTLTDTAGNFSLTFTAIPEPSTYAAILGALTVGFVLVRRRFGAARLNALA
jgi:hypothetical protein